MEIELARDMLGGKEKGLTFCGEGKGNNVVIRE